jgi:hypothetical protein
MRAQNLSTWLGEGRGLPLPSRSHPQKRNRAVYTKELTHLNGIFACARKGTVAFTAVAVKSDSGIVTAKVITDFCKPNALCASGRLDIFNEFSGKTSARAKADDFQMSPDSLKRGDIALLEAIHFVDLTIAYDNTGEVAGPVDALSLFPDGRIEWFSPPKECASKK